MSRVMNVGFVVVFAVGVYAAFVAAVYSIQDVLIFPAPEANRFDLDMQAARVGAEVVWTTTEDGVKLYGWHHAGEGRRAVLYFHGNAEMLGGRAVLADRVLSRGWDFVTFANRGYPGSEGEPSEAGMALDARAALGFVTEDLGIAEEAVVLHGWSLGGANAVALASSTDVAGLIVESSFASLREVAQNRMPFLPTGMLLRHPFDSWSVATEVACPSLVVHGTGDTVIDVEQARRMAERLPRARYVEVEGGSHFGLVPRDPAAWGAYEQLLTVAEEGNGPAR